MDLLKKIQTSTFYTKCMEYYSKANSNFTKWAKNNYLGLFLLSLVLIFRINTCTSTTVEKCEATNVDSLYNEIDCRLDELKMIVIQHQDTLVNKIDSSAKYILRTEYYIDEKKSLDILD